MKFKDTSDHLQLIKLLNRSDVLSLIRKKGPISRADIAEVTGLSRPSISSIVDKLISADLVKEVGRGPSSGGRRPIMLKFNACSYFIIGALFEGSTLSAVVTDLEGQILANGKTRISKVRGHEAVTKVADFLKDLYDLHKFPKEKLLGVGIGIPGVTWPKTGTVSLAPSVGWIKDFPLKQALEEKLNTPVIIENDVNTVALGEMWKGAGQGVKNLAVFHVGTGIGAGLITSGRLYRGFNGSAGEIGYFPIGAGSSNVGEFGLYEKNWALPTISKHLKENFGISSDEDLKNPVSTLVNLAGENEDANEYLQKACKNWAYGIACLICVFNPALVILAGELRNIKKEGLKVIKEHLENWLPFVPKLTFASLGDSAGNIGAALTVIHKEEDTIIKNSL